MFAGDMHNHNTAPTVLFRLATRSTVRSPLVSPPAAAPILISIGSPLATMAVRATATAASADNSANLPGDPTTTWSQTLGQTIDGITIASLKGTPNGTGSGATMWRWQSIKEVEYPIIVNRTPIYNKVLVEGLEWIVPATSIPTSR